MKRFATPVLIGIFCVFVLQACEPLDESSNEPEHVGEGIPWYEGSVEEAFKLAKAENKPIFLYWGAVWCPPCNQLKATVFKQRSFIEKTRLFVPVYLDGDTDNAQKYGEKFAVSGYPTLIVFDPAGEEITRIPGGLNLDRYVEVLDLSLQNFRSASQIFADLKKGNTLEERDFRLMSLYSWSQDKGKLLSDDAAELLYRMYSACPSEMRMEKSRLFTAWWTFRLQSLTDENKVAEPLSRAELVEAGSNIEKILNDEALVENNLFFILYDRGSSISALTARDTIERERLLSLWKSALELIENNKNLSLMENLFPLQAEIYLDNIESADEFFVDADFQKEILQKVKLAREKIDNKYDQSAVVYRAWNILKLANLNEDAESMLKEELARTDSPYYFMVDLADAAQKAGREDEAVSWLKRAYEESKEGSTRFQWGIIYLEGMVEMQANRHEDVAALSGELATYLEKLDDAFYNRNSKRVKRMSTALNSWYEQEKNEDVWLRIKSDIDALCKSFDAGSENFSRCQVFLSNLG